VADAAARGPQLIGYDEVHAWLAGRF